jgi:hypothetical protein
LALPDSATAAADPVNFRKCRRDNADMALPPFCFYARMMPVRTALRKRPAIGIGPVAPESKC